jgi:hypothetical protein
VNPITVALIDAATGQPVPATLHPSLTAAEVTAVEAVWGQLRRAAGGAHSHWDWSRKARRLGGSDVRCLGVLLASGAEGLTMLVESGWAARLDPDRGKPLVYVEYLEAAPWNDRTSVVTPRHKLVGTWLLGGAVQRSLELGFGGRVGLHALPDSEGFYEFGCGMTPVGPDPAYNWLMYYEFTAVEGAAFAAGLRGRK